MVKLARICIFPLLVSTICD